MFYTIFLEYNAKPRSFYSVVFPLSSTGLTSKALFWNLSVPSCPSPPPRSLRGSFTTSPGIITRFSFSPSFSPLNALPLCCLANYGADFLLLSILYQIAYAIGGDQRNAKQHRGWEAVNNNYFTCTLGRISLCTFSGGTNKVINW